MFESREPITTYKHYFVVPFICSRFSAAMVDRQAAVACDTHLGRPHLPCPDVTFRDLWPLVLLPRDGGELDLQLRFVPPLKSPLSPCANMYTG